MNRKIRVLASIVIFAIFVTIFVFGINNRGELSPLYEYVDLDNNIGTARYCDSEYGNLYCQNGFDKIQVKKYTYLK